MKEVCSPWSSGNNPTHSSGKPISPGARSMPGRSDQTDSPTELIRTRSAIPENFSGIAVHGPGGPQPFPDSTPEGTPQEHQTTTDRDPH
jgi:hypothetical protein